MTGIRGGLFWWLVVLLLLQGCQAVRLPEPDQGERATLPAEVEATKSTVPPSNPAADQLRAEALERLEEGDTARASAQLERSIRIDPSAAASYFHLARVRALEGLYAEARELLMQARSLLDRQGVRSGELPSAVEQLLVEIANLQRR